MLKMSEIYYNPDSGTRFIKDMVVEDSLSRVNSTDLFNAYREWLKPRLGIKLPIKDGLISPFGKDMSRRYIRAKIRGKSYYKGIRLRNEAARQGGHGE